MKSIVQRSSFRSPDYDKVAQERAREHDKRRKIARNASNRNLTKAVTGASTATMQGAVSGEAISKAEKAPPSGEAAHKAKLVALGCMACRRLFPYLPPGAVELHHLRAGGWGKGDYLTLIPLCCEHHRGDTGVHGLGTKAFPKRYGFDQADMLMDALSLIGATK